MPSTTSSSVSRLFASSTVITPSLPTFCIAWAIISPMSRSPLAEIVPTCVISSLVEIFFERFLMSSTTAPTATSMPRFRSIGLSPAATALAPSRTIAWARTVAVVVPSPARSDERDATSRTICAPMFSNLSSSSISLATVTPSLVMRGAPNDLSRTTLRPFGPSVTLTALARMSTPRSMRSRASTENLTSLAAMLWVLDVRKPRRGHGRGKCGVELGGFLLGDFAFDDAHDVALLHDQEILAVDLDLGARPFAEQHAVANLDVDGDELAGLVAATRANCDDFTLGRLLLGGVGNDDAAGGLCFGVDALDDAAVVKRAELHGILHTRLIGLVFFDEKVSASFPATPFRVASKRPPPFIQEGDEDFL